SDGHFGENPKSYRGNSDQEGEGTQVSGLLVEYLDKEGQPVQTMNNSLPGKGGKRQNCRGLFRVQPTSNRRAT
ncbi:MAG: hypothetical protein AB7U29_18815, partial [Desulfobulbus sp.]